MTQVDDDDAWRSITPEQIRLTNEMLEKRMKFDEIAAILGVDYLALLKARRLDHFAKLHKDAIAKAKGEGEEAA